MYARPPFNAAVARRLREALGMTPTHVAYGMWAAYGLRVPPDAISAWERADDSPTIDEITALAGALWCSPAELLGAPRTLREHRLAHGLPLPDLARRVGMPIRQYERIEETGQWTGSDQQAGEVADALQLPLRIRIELTGRQGDLEKILRSAASVRWQAYVRPLAKLLPTVPRRSLERVLERVNDEYHQRSFASLSWIDTSSETGKDPAAAGRAYLRDISAHFWELLAHL